jgi:hypothetical protein
MTARRATACQARCLRTGSSDAGWKLALVTAGLSREHRMSVDLHRRRSSAPSSTAADHLVVTPTGSRRRERRWESAPDGTVANHRIVGWREVEEPHRHIGGLGSCAS